GPERGPTPAADHGAHRVRDAGRPRAMPGGRHGPPPPKAGQAGRAVGGAEPIARRRSRPESDRRAEPEPRRVGAERERFAEPERVTAERRGADALERAPRREKGTRGRAGAPRGRAGTPERGGARGRIGFHRRARLARG